MGDLQGQALCACMDGERLSLCPVCPPSAFNNILSNLGYILLGLLFLLIILQREINHNRALLRNDLYALVGACGLAALPAPRRPQPAPLRALPSCLTPLLPSFPPPTRSVGSPNTSACSMPWAQPS